MQPGDHEGQAGFITLQHVLATGLSLVLLTVITNLVVLQYGRGVVRSALDEAARAGARSSSPVAACEQRGREVLADLLGGALGDGVTLRCHDAGTVVVAVGAGRIPGWLPPVPDWTFQLEATAVRESVP